MLLSLLIAGALFGASLQTDIAPSLVMDQGWVPYPLYADRDGWTAFLGEYQPIMVAKGEKYLGFEWVTITDDDYLAYDRYGDRAVMEDKQEANTDALSGLFIAELAEGKGRFLPDISRGVKWFCEAPSWVVSAHLAKYQKSKSPLPSPEEYIIDLYSGNISQLLSWIHYYLGPMLDSQLQKRLRSELQQRELDPYLQRDDFWWMGFVPRPGKKLNNWTPWCSQNALLCFMLLENDREVLARAVEKSMRSVDLWLESLQADGACDEGTTYWYKSVCYLMDYLQNLERLTGGTISMWDEPYLKALGEFIVNADIDDCWQVNFADGKPSRRPITYSIYRYGKACGDSRMMDFAVNRYRALGSNPENVDWTLFYQGLEAIAAVREMKQATASGYRPNPFVYYPSTDICFVRSGKGFLAAKGGHNNERHNHNDVGTCIYFYDAKPVLVDAGVGTYTKDTFGEGRKYNWFIQSGWHNLPVINGCDQVFGEEFKARGSKASACGRFVTDIAGAYPDSAEVKTWRIDYRLKKDGSMVIKEKFSLLEAREPNVLHFLVSGEPVIRDAGQIELSGGVVLKYNAKQFDASVEEKSLVGLGFSSRWGDSLYRIVLTAKKLQKKGQYVVKLVPPASESMSKLSSRVADTAKGQFELMSVRLADDATPRTILPDGNMKDCSVGSWTSGFFSGSLWMLYQLTGDEKVLELARKETAKMASVLEFPLSHDIGFQVNCSYGNAYRITGDEQYRQLIEEAAEALAGRFNPTVGATLSWSAGEKGEYPVIIDNMMNLELLEYASKLFSSDTLQNIAIAHARTTMENHFRPDFTTWHMLDYNPSTGEVLRRVTVQGYSDDSAWARGQAWALYGFTMMFRETGLEEFLQQAENVARMLLPRLPYDGIPYWDFDDPEIPFTYKDASAGAIMCSAFIELSTLTSDKALASSCFQMAEKQLRTLASPEYLAPVGTNGNFLLKHSVGNLPGGSEIDVPLPYADYYFLEALNRYLAL
ncbi:MAG: glycoside hydrolase family 88 protein [Bacteroidales bacterium]|nr:glycoside hydrolase family 88 protein [Bacteroidales bacterium]